MSFNQKEENQEEYKEFLDQINELEKSLDKMKRAWADLDKELMKEGFYEMKKRVDYIDKEMLTEAPQKESCCSGKCP